MQVANARPYQAIIAAASDRGCDLIVMGSHGRGGLSAVVLDSVTNKVLTHTKTPVGVSLNPRAVILRSASNIL
jgi:nucleotide-binding universal stress UspA family protein